MEYAAQIIDLHKEYDLGPVKVHALRGVSIDIPNGDFLAIMGTSGSGKSTLLNLLGALDRPTRGQYILRGKDVAVLDDDELSEIRNQSIGFIFQSFNLIAQYTVLENIEVPLLYRPGYPPLTEEDHERCLEVANLVGLGDRLDHKPFQLSGGQQQRVAIARSLINNPAIIMADEPTGNLDSATGTEIMKFLRKLNEQGRTIIMVTHEPSIARQAKRAIYMKDGLVAGEGVFPVEEIDSMQSWTRWLCAWLSLFAAVPGSRLCAETPPAANGAEPAQSASVRVAVYDGKGASDSRNKLIAVLKKRPGLDVRDITVDEIRAGKLSEFDVVIHPGGSGSGQGKALGEEGRAAVTRFIESDGGYIGVCAGAYLATCDYEWSLGILDARVVDRKHWNRGFGQVQIGLSGKSKEVLGVDADKSPIYYHQGPLLAPASNPDIPDYEEVAKFDTEIVKNGASPGVMTGCTAIAIGSFKEGRVLCFSPHPEHDEPTEPMLVKAVEWAARPRQDRPRTD